MKEEKTVFYPYSSWLKQRYGEKVYKLPGQPAGILPEPL